MVKSSQSEVARKQAIVTGKYTHYVVCYFCIMTQMLDMLTIAGMESGGGRMCFGVFHAL